MANSVQAIADGMPSCWRAAVLLMASVGTRLGETLGLTVDRVDFLRRTIRIDRQVQTSSAGVGFTTPKTRAGVRTIPVPAEVVELIAAHLAEHPAGRDGLIFTSPLGGPVTRSRWSGAYRIAVAAGGTGRHPDPRSASCRRQLADRRWVERRCGAGGARSCHAVGDVGRLHPSLANR